MNDHPLVLVEWEDAYSEGGGVWDHGDGPPTACIVKQVGWLIYQDDERIALVSGYADGSAQGRFVIPVGMVRSITALEPCKSKRRR
jgi:hypothetical protein